MKTLDGNVSIITGAGAGMGRAMVQLFLEHGSRVLAADIREDRLGSLVAECAAGDRLVPLKTDMALAADVERMFDTALARFGTVDILINNAGIMDNMQPVGEAPDALFERVMAVNVTGPFRAMRRAIQIMLPKASGVIINIASIGGLQGARAGAVYTTSKFALIGLTRNTGYMYAKSGIRCNAIAPGAVATSITETMDLEHLPALAVERIMPGMALNPSTGTAMDIARTALFLASGAAAFVNGAVLVADGGWTAY